MEEKQVQNMFSEGYDCSQIVLSSVADRLGISRETAMSATSGLGVGLCRGSICGAALGAIVALGFRYGNVMSFDIQSKADIFAKREEFLRRFEAINGKLLCSDLIGVSIGDLNEMIGRSEEGIYENCPRYCMNAISILEDLIS